MCWADQLTRFSTSYGGWTASTLHGTRSRPKSHRRRRRDVKQKRKKKKKAPTDIDLDSSSRPICAVLEVGQRSLTPAELRAEQRGDGKLGPIMSYLEKGAASRGPRLYKRYLLNEHGVLYKQACTGRPAPVFLMSLQKVLIRNFHEGAFGGHRSERLPSRRASPVAQP